MTNAAAVKFENIISEEFQVAKVVHQGWILSPDLFNIMRKVLDGWEGGISIERMKISNLRYAGDTYLIAASEAEMAELLQRVECESQKSRLKINKKKTKLMFVDRCQEFQLMDQLPDLEVVQYVAYLPGLYYHGHQWMRTRNEVANYNRKRHHHPSQQNLEKRKHCQKDETKASSCSPFS